jgi:hypothetical protein
MGSRSESSRWRASGAAAPLPAREGTSRTHPVRNKKVGIRGPSPERVQGGSPAREAKWPCSLVLPGVTQLTD